jgi:hypothetical protein
VVNGKNIWRNNYAETLKILSDVKTKAKNVAVSASCSLLHVPYTVSVETALSESASKHFAFAEEKLIELAEIARLADDGNYLNDPAYAANAALHADRGQHSDAGVISFEASRSSLVILGAIKDSGFETAVGPGVYDIHSPRVPSEKEITDALNVILKSVKPEKLWVNPDCGLKTRGNEETVPSLKNLVAAAKAVRGKVG